ncbi:diacylglyceryl-N,N,N-trimethylhomoserine synthesis protein [Coccomyxa subellipsoidea C-169]|uniref:Diacylglyceryl-N,N,N-trimethylhomoserine synthesis protein n=1 Tax=Coccomyxa subellipsoidea (strain C-169) TaxID=574566 RepID=I0Z283_COCSC|nr:diacylglyceryl-N,N,N-trimethylhomoserine synthesis protein [Coccomyxa subellipsoidea C-169]EIE24752.1 diacylglyceryl-N,N,N-trimethylhomoserine synthesis protein [Coccomyxa subellipsoidea C-169]|eukprot:XP_005649296.1 diacylglyceryl-N,N,N-trimethylhomoserine synthesis protein [Coccomyxa subellipsoidea C-169]
MGKGAYGAVDNVPAKKDTSILKRLGSSGKLKRISSVADDLLVLKSIWFNKASGDDHAERLENFYGPQAEAYDNFRSKFLWGRKPMLAACAARLADKTDLVWVDLGGGTGENVDMMAEYLPLENFKTIYVVDLCKSLCEQAKKKVDANGWKNVVVVEGDACTFTPPSEKVTLVTFSYSLSMIPPFHSAVDRAISYLDPSIGLLGVADFYVPSKYDLPLRQMSWLRRFFWRATFDTDNIDIGPERRNYLDHRLSRVWEMNSEGSIPYVPFLRAPYYVWVGHVPQLATVMTENKVEAPPMFPPTFLYTMSWEDPRPDMEVLKINNDDTVLTLTSGGCNSLNLLLHGAGHVVSVDCNPAQSALLELKATGIRQLQFEDFWQLFGEGKHPKVDRLYETKLAPFLTQTSHKFWKDRLWYFKQGLYYQGGMGQVVYYMQLLSKLFGMGGAMERLANAPTLAQQRAAWDSAWFVRFCSNAPAWIVDVSTRLIALLCFNRFVMWFGAGVPCKQYKLIHKDGLRISTYVARTFDGAARSSHLRKDNYFYYNCCTARFARDNCPSYLIKENFTALKNCLIDNLTISTGTFMDALTSRIFTKVILMDHVDWQDMSQARVLAATLAKHVAPGGRVIWRSAALCPPYTRIIREAGFEVKCLQRADEGYMDRVNMYSSFYVAVRKPTRAQ